MALDLVTNSWQSPFCHLLLSTSHSVNGGEYFLLAFWCCKYIGLSYPEV